MGPLPLESSVGLDEDVHIKIARWSAPATMLTFTRETQPRSRIHPSRYLDFDRAVLFDPTFTFADSTRVGNHPAVSPALGASTGDGKETLTDPNLSIAATGRTGFWRRIGAAACAGAFRTAFEARDLQHLLGPERGLFEGKAQLIAQIRTRFATAAAAATGEQITKIQTEKVTQDVGEVTKGRCVEATEALTRDCLVSESIVARSLVGVREDGIGLRSLLELLLCLLVARVPVGVKANGLLPIGGLDLGLRGVATDRKDLVVIALRCHLPGSSTSARWCPTLRPLAA